MNDLLADVSGIQGTASRIDETASDAMNKANQVLSIADGTNWKGRADTAFVNAVESFREKKDRLGQLLTQIGGNVDTAAQDHDANEEDQAAGMAAKASAIS